MHASVILGQGVQEYAPLFSEVADAYYDQRMYDSFLLTPGARHDSPGKVIIKYFLIFFTMESRYNFHD